MKQFILIPILAISLLLAACGGADQAAAPPPAPAAIAATPQPAAAETPAPTVEPPPDPAPTAEPASPVSPSGWGESQTTAQTACDHPYFPLRTGYYFIMRGDDGQDMRWEVLSVAGDSSQATAVMQMTWDDLQFTYTWDCSASGGLVSYEFTNPALSPFSPAAQITITGGSGSYLPPYEEMAPGYTWQTSFASELALTEVEEGLEIEVSGTIDTTQNNEIVSDAPATFDGREIPAILIHQDLTMAMAMTALDNTIENEMQMAGELLFGRGIGMLEQTTFSEFGDFTSVLQEVYVP